MALADVILRYLQALVWPLVVLIIAVMFRRSIRAAVGRLTEVTGPGVSAKFETEAESMAAQAKEAAARQPALMEPYYWSISPYRPGSSHESDFSDGVRPGSRYTDSASEMPDEAQLPYEPPSRYAPITPQPSGKQADHSSGALADAEGEAEVTAPQPLPVPPRPSAPTPSSRADQRMGRSPEPPRPPPKDGDRMLGDGPGSAPTPQQPFPRQGTPSPYRRSPDEVRSRVRTAFAAARSTADFDPAAAVHSAWLDVARAVEELTSSRVPGSPEAQLIRLFTMGVTAEVRELLRRLDRMRGDAAAHPDSVTSAAARAYVTAAEEAVFALYWATGKMP